MELPDPTWPYLFKKKKPAYHFFSTNHTYKSSFQKADAAGEFETDQFALVKRENFLYSNRP
jgi:hypothetical protein